MVFEGTCFALSNDGKGIVRHNNSIVLVDNLLEGENAKIKIYKKLSKCSYGKVVELLSTSPNRIEPKCPYFEKCGGCPLMNLSYENQCSFKKKQIQDSFKKIANKEIEIKDFIKSPEHEYRNKIYLQVSNNHLGYFGNGSHEFVPVNSCLLVDEHTNYLIVEINKILKDIKPDIKALMVRKSFSKRQVMIVFVSEKEDFKNKNDFVWKLRNLHVTTIIQNINADPKKDLSNHNITIDGKGFIEDEISGYTFKVSPSSFYQVNGFITKDLYDLAIKKLQLKKTDNLLDAYCGVGTMGIIASNKVNSVIGVEINKDAIKDANVNKELNNVNNINFYAEDVKEYIKKDEVSNVLLIDPPRAGCDKEFLDIVLKKNFEKIVYVSCNYQTLARDLTILEEKYEVASIDAVDLFPNSYHVETVCLLKQKERD